MWPERTAAQLGAHGLPERPHRERIHLRDVLVGRAVRVTIPNSLSKRDREEVDLLGLIEGAR